MFIPDPDFYPSRIPDLGYWSQKQQQKKGVKKKLVVIFLCCHKFYKVENYFSFNNRAADPDPDEMNADPQPWF
jgi:hypothetical protein